MPEYRPSYEHLIKDFLGRKDYYPLKQHELAKALRIKSGSRRDFRSVLAQLERSGQVVRLRKNRWALPDSNKQVTGILQVNPKGFGFVLPQGEREDDVYVAGTNLGMAIHGDKVTVAILSSKQGRRGRPVDSNALREGRVVEVLERSHEQVAGILMKSHYYWYVVPDDHRITPEVRVADSSQIDPAKCERHKVVVKLLPPEPRAQFLEGLLIEDLGPSDTPGIEILSLMRNYGLTDVFPAEVQVAADSVTPELAEAHHENRVDLRAHLTFTIDPEDAKDYDDAVSLESTPEGNWKLGVHIADVPHFVPPGSPIDLEAYQRGTSVYLVDRVVSMLPRHLTRDVCSLQPRVDRLTHTAEMIVSPDGELLKETTFLSVINSRQRLNYGQVQTLFDGGEEHGILPEVCDSLRSMRDLASLFREQRTRNGAITFNVPEVKCILDDEGGVTEIVRRGAKEAYNLIEEFMLIANQVVARKITEATLPGIYRIHPPPDERDWEKMSADLAKLGLTSAPSSQDDMNRLAAETLGTPTEYSVMLAMLRNMKRAYYSPALSDHFGLAFTHYTHFTSPIRRYPDLVVHRVLRAIETREKPPYDKNAVREIAEHCSLQEQLAEEAERESVEIKRLEYYHRRLWAGATGPYKATIVSIARKGMIVEMADSLQRGMVAFASLTDDYYVVDHDRGHVQGKKAGRTFDLGNILDVELVRVDTARRFVDFRLKGQSERKGRRRKRRSSGSGR